MTEIINSLWVGRSLSLMEQLSITSFLRNGHEYHLHCYNEITNVPAGTIMRDAAEILPSSEIFYYRRGAGKGSAAAFSNLFRFKLLFEKGGWWADTDVVCLRRFDFAAPVVFASERTRTGTQAANAVIKLPQGHAVARLCYEAASREDRTKLTWGKTGPLLLDRIVCENGLQQFIKAPGVFCPLDHWEWKLLLSENSKPLAERVMDESRAIHLWHEHWRRAGLELDPATGEHQSTRLFPRIRRRFGFGPKPAQNGTTPIAGLLRQFGLKK
jgi:Glycosyltransferase sugar-binding region containing DXD motif